MAILWKILFLNGTKQNILTHFDKISKYLGEDVNVVYLDFVKAFDKVNISIILNNIKH